MMILNFPILPHTHTHIHSHPHTYSHSLSHTHTHIHPHTLTHTQKSNEKVNTGIRHPYIRVIGVEVDDSGSGRTSVGGATLSTDDERKLRDLCAKPNIYDMISKSIAPSIFGCTDMKRAIACLLFGGSRKR